MSDVHFPIMLCRYQSKNMCVPFSNSVNCECVTYVDKYIQLYLHIFYLGTRFHIQKHILKSYYI